MEQKTAMQTALANEIERQIAEIDIKLEAEVRISVYVKLLAEKRQLQTLLNENSNGK